MWLTSARIGERMGVNGAIDRHATVVFGRMRTEVDP
jgi:hypothetical protein